MDTSLNFIQFELVELKDWILQQKSLLDSRYLDLVKQDSHVFYTQILHDYLIGDTESLKSNIQSYNKPNDIWFKLALLRLLIRQKQKNNEIATELISALKSVQNEILIAEAHFVLGLYYNSIFEPQFAQNYYLSSYGGFKKGEFFKKAVKAYLNYLVSESRIYPHKKLIQDYLYILELAIKVGDFGSQSVIYLNLSREFQILGAYELALKYCNQSLKTYSSSLLSMPYYLIVVHKCELLFLLDRKNEAILEYQTALTSEHLEIKNALKIIENRFFNATNPIDTNTITPTWQERLTSTSIKPNSELENKFIEILSKGERSFNELAFELYGEKEDVLSLQNRLKVFLNRFRKKFPDLIVKNGKKYRIADEIFLTQKVGN